MGNRFGVAMRGWGGEREGAVRGEKGEPFVACLLSAATAIGMNARLHSESLNA